MSVSIKYKGAEIASASTEVTKTIKTAGKYCEADILVENTPDGGDAPVINPLSITANGTYTAPSGVDGYSPVTVNVPQGITPMGNINITDTNPTDVTNYATAQISSDTLLAENIKKNVNILGVVGSFEGGGGLPPTLKELNSGIITFAQDFKVNVTDSNCAKIPHGLTETPNFGAVYALQNTANGRPASATLIGGGSTIYFGAYTNSNGVISIGGGASAGWNSIVFDSTNIKIGAYGSTYYIHAGVPYFWIAGIADYEVQE